MSVDPRFWERVPERGEGCWLWQGKITPQGYGVLWLGHRRMFRAHRYAYEQLVGPIPEGLTIDHLCRNRRCVNPAHLEAVTNRENVLRGDTLPAANVRKTTCPKGHPLDGKRGNGDRYCRTCTRERCHRYYLANRERELAHAHERYVARVAAIERAA